MTELEKVKTVKEMLAKKGWPNSLQEMLQGACDKVLGTCEHNTKLWIKEVLHVSVPLPEGVTGKECQLHEETIKQMGKKAHPLQSKKKQRKLCFNCPQQ